MKPGKAGYSMSCDYNDIVDFVSNIIFKLRRLKSEMKNHQRNVNVAKGVGTTLNTIGSVASISSIFLGPRGALVAKLVAIIATVGGTSTNYTAKLINSQKSSECVENIQNILCEYETRNNSSIQAWSSYLTNQIFTGSNKSSVNYEASLALVNANNEGILNLQESFKVTNVSHEILKGAKNVQNCINLVCTITAFVDPEIVHGIGKACLELGIPGSDLMKPVLSTICGIPNSEQESNVREILSCASKIAIGVGCVIQVIEVVSTVVDVCTENPTIPKIGLAIIKLESIHDGLGSILNEIKHYEKFSSKCVRLCRKLQKIKS